MKLVNKKQKVSFNVKLRKTKAAFVLKPVNFVHYFWSLMVWNNNFECLSNLLYNKFKFADMKEAHRG